MRIQGWENRVEKYIQETALKKFSWDPENSCDCLVFVSDAAMLICEKDPMSKVFEADPDTIRGAYRTEKEAKALIRKYRSSTPKIMDALFTRIDPAFAQRGDIVLQKLPRGMTFGLVWSKGISFFKTIDEGFEMMNGHDADMAWRVE